MIYFIVTTSLYNDTDLRKNQYNKGINKLKEVIQNLNIEDYKIIIIENNGKRKTFLDMFGCDVFYTNNNSIPTSNIGIKELKDINDCIIEYKINDSDFIVKMTGRYILDDNSEFMNIIKDIHKTKYDCVIKYGSYYAPVNYKTNDCVTGLIGMSCYYVKQIVYPEKYDVWVEWKWAETTNLMDEKKIYIVNNLDIQMCPGGNEYFHI